MLLLSPEGEVRREVIPLVVIEMRVFTWPGQHWLCSDVFLSLQEVAVRSTVFKTAVEEEEDEEEQEAEVIEERFFHQQV